MAQWMSHTQLGALNGMARWPALNHLLRWRVSVLVWWCMACTVGGNQCLCSVFKEITPFWIFLHFNYCSSGMFDGLQEKFCCDLNQNCFPQSRVNLWCSTLVLRRTKWRRFSCKENCITNSSCNRTFSWIFLRTILYRGCTHTVNTIHSQHVNSLAVEVEATCYPTQ